MSSEIIKVERGGDYLDITLRYRLWEAVPKGQRVRESDIRDRYRNYRGDDNRYMLDELEVLRNPRCIVAVKQPGKPLWGPCRRPVADGQDLCKAHGGVSTRKTPSPSGARIRHVRELEAEVERLRAALGAQPDTPDIARVAHSVIHRVESRAPELCPVAGVGISR